MGAVLLAWDPKLHREVALKLVGKNVAAGAKGRERFEREARAIAALRHPNIVEIYDYSGEESEHLYLVMERLDGNDLFNILGANGPFPEPVVAALGHELCLALRVAHEGGIIHRDLKPENVFLNGAGRVVLTDFGVVKAVREGSAVSGFGSKTDIIGTPGFMAPELMDGKPLGSFTDVFALGALLYNVTTAELPYPGANPLEVHRAIVAGKLVDPRTHVPTLSDDLVKCLMECLDANPKKRPSDMDALRDVLKGVLKQHGVTDLRDDLAGYMRDPQGYAEMSKQRATQHLVRSLKIAVRDKDSAGAAQLQRRLWSLDPKQEGQAGLSGVLHAAKERSADWDPQDTSSHKRKRAMPFYLGTAAVVIVAVGLTVLVTLKPKELPKEAPPLPMTVLLPAADLPQRVPEPEPPPAPKPDGFLAVRVKGAAQVFLDGEKQTKQQLRRATLPSGTHRVDAVTRGKRFGTDVNVQPGEKTIVVVDVKRQKVIVLGL